LFQKSGKKTNNNHYIWEYFPSLFDDFLDEKDELIIKVLSRRSGMPIRTLSSMLLLPISTIHRRIKRLEEDGVINGYRAIVDFEKTSSAIGAILMIDLFEVVPGKGHVPKKVIVGYLEKLER